jgi:hypothetical protein
VNGDVSVSMRVVFCGACNPAFDMGALAAAVNADANAREEDGEDALLLLNGCGAGCLKPEKYAGQGEIVCVRGLSVDGWPAREEELPSAVAAALRKRTDSRE